MDNISVWSDGGCNGANARDGDTYGSFRVFKDKVEIYHSVKIQHGAGSNQTAEYKTLIAALKWCRDNGCEHPTVYIDSQFVCSQVDKNPVTGVRWRVKDERIKPLWREAVDLGKEVFSHLVWVERSRIVAVLGH